LNSREKGEEEKFASKVKVWVDKEKDLGGLLSSRHPIRKSF
jgi:hypothetical protein